MTTKAATLVTVIAMSTALGGSSLAASESSAETQRVTNVRVDGQTVRVPASVANELELSRDEVLKGWQRFEAWAAVHLPKGADLGKYADGGWLAVPVESEMVKTSEDTGHQRAGYVYCKGRKDTRRSYRAVNVYDQEVWRVVGSLPFCVNALTIKVKRHKAFRSHVKVKDWVKKFVRWKRRTDFHKAHYVKWRGRKHGSVRGATRYKMQLESGPIVAGAHCPRIRIRGLGNARVKVSGNAVRGC